MVVKLCMEFIASPKQKNGRTLMMLALDYEIPWGYFDKASQGHSLVYGIVVLHLSHSHIMHRLFCS